MIGEESKRRAIANQLRAGARGYASGAAEDMLSLMPEIGAKQGAGAYFIWQGFLSQRVSELATAVELNEPSLFSTELNWLYSTLAARQVEPQHVRLSVSSLGRTLRVELPEASWLLVKPVMEHAERANPTGMPVDTRMVHGGADGELGAALLDHALAGETSQAVELLLRAYRNGIEAGGLYERVILPVQAELGNLWQAGEVGVADEHVATEVIRSVMTMLWYEATGGSVDGPPVIVGTVTGDQHDTGVRAAAQILDINGVRGICLGCDVPIEDFPVAAARYNAVAAIVSASMSVHLPRVRQTVVMIKESIPDLRVIVGGPAFGSEDEVAQKLAMKLGADAFARTPTAAASLIGLMD